jgi:hypothetical protein
MVAPGSVVTLTVSTGPCNNPPVANAGPDQADKGLGDVQLDGSGSYDLDSDEITYFWTVITEPSLGAAVLSNPTLMSPVLTIDEYGTYEIELVVYDGTDYSTPDTVVISTHENLPPVADAGEYPEPYLVNDYICLNGSGSSDPNDDEITYSWTVTKPDGSQAELQPGPTDEEPCFSADQAGEYQVQLIVHDGEHNSEPDTTTIFVEENHPPVADAGSDMTVLPGEEVCLDASASYDPDGDPISYDWASIHTPVDSQLDMEALNSATGEVFCFIPDVTGEYQVQLIVCDDKDACSDPPATVVVTAAECGDVEGDLDGDCDVDRDDLNIILAARNTPADGPDDPRDLDGDGVITVLDARKLVLLCTRTGCATE